ncbi:sensor histidine kinase [Paraburkholderia azotifigens]|uniref:sensor histidine kinase n=1 Tax=Paraburkholderia azotifigens TaxID=2057004 RepID=UPI003175D3A6
MSELMQPAGLFLSTATPEPHERRAACITLIVSAALFAVLAPYAAQPLPALWAFVPVYNSAIAINDVVTAGLLLGQFTILRSMSLLVLAGGYLFTGLMAGAHMLSFPGVFSTTGWLGAGEQTTAWLYVFWHGSFPLVVVSYVLLGRPDGLPPAPAAHPSVPMMACAAAALVAGIGCVVLTTGGEQWLPRIMHGHRMTSTMTGIIATVWLLNLLALIVVWRRRPRSVLDLWLAIVMVIWLLDIAMSAMLNHGRFDVGFYAGRIYGLLASGVVLFVLLFENSKLYARAVRALEGEKAQHAHVLEKTAELNQANELLEQRVARRTAELSRSNEKLLAEIEERKRAESALQASRNELREISALSSSAREAEQRRIARELHDELAQTMATLNIDLDRLAALITPGQAGSDARRRIEAMHTLVTNAVGATRRIASDLRPLMLDDLGFTAAVQWLVQTFEVRHGITCALNLEPADPHLAEPYATAVFRIIQEALANIARHARASRVDIDLRITAAGIAVSVHDNGAGFDPAAPRKASSFGLVGLRERAYLVGGTFHVDTAPGKGAIIEVQIPCITQEQADRSDATQPGA